MRNSSFIAQEVVGPYTPYPPKSTYFPGPSRSIYSNNNYYNNSFLPYPRQSHVVGTSTAVQIPVDLADPPEYSNEDDIDDLEFDEEPIDVESPYELEPQERTIIVRQEETRAKGIWCGNENPKVHFPIWIFPFARFTQIIVINVLMYTLSQQAWAHAYVKATPVWAVGIVGTLCLILWIYEEYKIYDMRSDLGNVQLFCVGLLSIIYTGLVTYSTTFLYIFVAQSIYFAVGVSVLMIFYFGYHLYWISTIVQKSSTRIRAEDHPSTENVTQRNADVQVEHGNRRAYGRRQGPRPKTPVYHHHQERNEYNTITPGSASSYYEPDRHPHSLAYPHPHQYSHPHPQRYALVPANNQMQFVVLRPDDEG